jgi:hypothetical protein
VSKAQPFPKKMSKAQPKRKWTRRTFVTGWAVVPSCRVGATRVRTGRGLFARPLGLGRPVPLFCSSYDLLHRAVHGFFVYIQKKLCSVVYCVYAEDDPASIVGRTDHTVTVLSELRGNSSHELICSTSCKLGSATI